MGLGGKGHLTFKKGSREGKCSWDRERCGEPWGRSSSPFSRDECKREGGGKIAGTAKEEVMRIRRKKEEIR